MQRTMLNKQAHTREAGNYITDVIIRNIDKPDDVVKDILGIVDEGIDGVITHDDFKLRREIEKGLIIALSKRL